jgi:tRNA (guanine37-N1)-methyltransferase
VPEVLLSGHHGRITRWRRDEALRRTADHRPDLIERCDPAAFDRGDRDMLAVLGWQPGPGGRYVKAPGRGSAEDGPQSGASPAT